MKISGKDNDREVHVIEDTGGFLISERQRYLPLGYARHKWDIARVFLTSSEVQKLYEFMHKDRS